MTSSQSHICRNCGNLFTASERPCPHPAPGREYKETGRGGHMFYPSPPPRPPEPMTKGRLQEIEALAGEALNDPTSFDLDNVTAALETLFVDLRKVCTEIKLLLRAAATVPELLAEVGRLRAECKRLRRVMLETADVFTREQIEQMMEVEP